MDKPLVLVAGATGVIGRQVLHQLRVQGHRTRTGAALIRPSHPHTSDLIDFARVFTSDCVALQRG